MATVRASQLVMWSAAAWRRVPPSVAAAVQHQLLVHGVGRWNSLPRSGKRTLQACLSRRESACLDNRIFTRHGLVTLVFEYSGLVVTLTQPAEVGASQRTVLVSLARPLIYLWSTNIAVSWDETELFVMSSSVDQSGVQVYRLPDGVPLRTWHPSMHLPLRGLCPTLGRTVFGFHLDGKTLMALDAEGHPVQRIATTPGQFFALRSSGDLVFALEKTGFAASLMVVRVADGAIVGRWELPVWVEVLDQVGLVFTPDHKVAAYVDHVWHLLPLHSGWLRHVA